MTILLPFEIEFRGSCKGITATQVERTKTKALYKRSDDVFECFFIQKTRHIITENGVWTDTGDIIERYPKDELFGVTAWSGSEKKIRGIYNHLNSVSGGDVMAI